jgi:hypothetical protein
MTVSFTTLEVKLLFHDDVNSHYYYSTNYPDPTNENKKLGFLYRYEVSTMRNTFLSYFMGKSLYMPLGINFSKTMDLHGYIDDVVFYGQVEAFKFSTIPVEQEIEVKEKPKIIYYQDGIESFELKTEPPIVYGNGSSIITVTIESVNLNSGVIDINCSDTELIFRFRTSNENIVNLLNSHIGRKCEIKANNLQIISINIVDNCTLCNLI